MPYSSHKSGKNQITVTKKDTDEVVGHTTPENYNGYMAALHIHSGDKAAEGGIVDNPDLSDRGPNIEALHAEDNPSFLDQALNSGKSAVSGALQGITGGLANKLPGLAAQTLQAAPMPSRPMPGALAPIPPQSASSPISATPQTPTPRLPGMPPGVTPDEIEKYIGTQKQNINKFGPEQQLELEKNLINQRNSFGNRLTSGAKGLADAVMMGVAGAGNPGYQRDFENRQDQMAGEQMGALQKAQEGNLQLNQAGMGLDKMNPNSPVSKIAQQANKELLVGLGIPAFAVSKMPADLISDVASKKVSAYEAMSRILETGAYHKADIGLKEQGLAQTKNEQQLKNKEWMAEHPILSRLGGVGNNNESVGHGVPDLGSTFNGQKVIGVKRIK